MEFVTYKKYYEQERVDALTEIFNQHQIEFHVDEERESLDSLYGDKHFSKQFFVKIRQNDFAKADSIMHDISQKELETVDKDHYLYAFTDEELFDILSKPDEWNEFDYELAKKILNERGKEINTDTVDLLKKQRLKELTKPEESQSGMIYAGYILSLISGILGVFVGWYLCTYKKVLPNGQKVYGFSRADRAHGTRIWVIGAALTLIYMALRISDTYH